MRIGEFESYDKRVYPFARTCQTAQVTFGKIRIRTRLDSKTTAVVHEL